MTWLHCVIDVPDELHQDTAQFWTRALGWPLGDPWPNHPEFRSFQPSDGDAYVHLQRIDGPQRVHFDVEVDDPSSEAARLADLGASVGYAEPAGCWQAMTSPGGLPFCLVPARDHRMPGPVDFGGLSSRLVQVCIDVPHDDADAELAFWHRALRGRWAASDGPGFAGKFHDDAGSLVQLLFQRLNQASGPVRAHIDLGSDDVGRDVSRLNSLGAVTIHKGHGWVMLRSPAGQAFCTTGNSPEATRYRDIGLEPADKRRSDRVMRRKS